MATVDSDKVVCGGIHAMIVAVLVEIILCTQLILHLLKVEFKFFFRPLIFQKSKVAGGDINHLQ
jgi:hypothetical protein